MTKTYSAPTGDDDTWSDIAAKEYEANSKAYMFCHHQKGGDCWPKGYSPRVMCFDDNKLYKNYLVLIEVQECISGWYRY